MDNTPDKDILKNIADTTTRDLTVSILDIFSEEYKRHSGEVIKRVEFQQNILRMQIIIIGAVIAAIVHLLSNNVSQDAIHFFMLLATLPFYFLSWSYSNHDLFIVANAGYLEHINKDIREHIAPSNLLSWECFLGNYRKWRAEKFPVGLIIGEEYLLALLIPIIFTVTAGLIIVSDFNGLNITELYSKTVQVFLSDGLYITIKRIFTSVHASATMIWIIKSFLFVINILLIYYTKRSRDLTRTAYQRIDKPNNSVQMNADQR